MLGTTQMPHMVENLGAEGVRSTSTEIGNLDKAVGVVQPRGARLPDSVLAYSDVKCRRSVEL